MHFQPTETALTRTHKRSSIAIVVVLHQGLNILASNTTSTGHALERLPLAQLPPRLTNRGVSVALIKARQIF
jgi:hypothetical protein